MKVMVNASTCVVGGGVQVARTFIGYALRGQQDHNFRFAVSGQVMNELARTGMADYREVICLTVSPAKPLKGMDSRRRVLELERKFRPDAVFTVFGPAYVKFRAPHICGFADPWVTHPSRIAIKSLSLFRQFKYLAYCKYKEFQLSKKDYYWVESEPARRGLVRILKISESQIIVIPNTYSDVFLKSCSTRTYQTTIKNSQIHIFTLAAPYPHKNLSIIPEVASILRRSDKQKYRFVVTLPKDGLEVRRFWRKARRLGVIDSIENVGPLGSTECPDWYHRSDIVFLPTLLESFSASYPEAMQMGRPIVTTDLDFAHDICGDAALYYSPLDAQSAADAIRKLTQSAVLRGTLIKNGYDRVRKFPTPDQKYQLLIDWIKEASLRTTHQ